MLRRASSTCLLVLGFHLLGCIVGQHITYNDWVLAILRWNTSPQLQSKLTLTISYPPGQISPIWPQKDGVMAWKHENKPIIKNIIPWISLALNWRNVHCFAMEPGCFGFKSRRAPVYGSRGMVATSQPLASEVEHGRLMPWHGVIELIAWDLRRTVQDVELAWIIVT